MKIIKDPFEMQSFSLERKKGGRSIALVPTMGYFHEGHLSLMKTGRKEGDLLVVSNFVNPTQFSPNEDLEDYPRNFDKDVKDAEQIPVDVMFAPSVEEMYGKDFRTYVEVEGWGKRLCGVSRPTHFRGVSTVVLKLFNIVQPNAAVFGWKDAQQFLILRKMVVDLNLPIKMIGGEIVREPDGIAMSSRNKYLTPPERKQATVISRSLFRVKEMIEKEGVTDTEQLKQFISDRINQTGTGKTDYVEIVSIDSIEPLETVEKGNTLIAVAARFGKARLIDNIRY